MKSKESDTVTQEPVFLKTFVETIVQTETTETQEITIQYEVETVETHEVAVQTKQEEEPNHILDVQTQEATTQVEVVELQETEEVTLLNIEASKWKHHASQFDEG